MQCLKCKETIQQNSKFCSFCGAPQPVPAESTTISEKSKSPPAFAIIIAVLVAFVAIVGAASTAMKSESTLGESKEQKAATPQEYEQKLALFEASILSENSDELRSLVTTLKDPPTDELNERSLQLKAEAAAIFAQKRIESILAEEANVQDKFRRLERLKADIDTAFSNTEDSIQLIEDAVVSLVRPLPANMLPDNVVGYEVLTKLRPENGEYAAKQKEYLEKLRAEQKAEAERAEAKKKQRVSSILSKYRKEIDKFNNASFYTHPNSPRYNNSRSTVFLYIGESSGRYFLRMKTQYAAENWLFVESVQGYANGTTFLLTSGNFERDNHSSIWEWRDEAPSNAQLDRLSQLANASDATLRYEGSTYRKDVQLSAGDRKALREVIADYNELNNLK